MALDGLGLASGLIATGARLGCGLGDLRLGPRCRCRLGLNDGRLDLLDLGCYWLRLGLGGRFRLNDGLGRGLGVAIGTLQQSFLRVEGFFTLCTLHGDPGAVAREAAGLHVVPQLHAHVLVH